VFGVIPNIRSKGLGAKKVLQKLFKLRIEEDANGGPELNGFKTPQQQTRHDIDTLVIIDREVDLVSPLVTPLTYEGLMDELLGIFNSAVRLDPSTMGEEFNKDTSFNFSLPAGMDLPGSLAGSAASITAPKASKQSADIPPPPPAASSMKPKPSMVTISLTNNDSIYSDIRNLSIEKLGSYMQEKAIHIRQRYTAFKENKDASLTEIHDFVKKIPKLTRDYKSLNQHISIAALIKSKTDTREFRDQWQGERGMLEGDSFLDAIEEMLYSDVDCTGLNRILRLLCIQSLTAGGIRANRYDSIRKAIVQTYGYQHIFTLSNFERSGLLRRKDTVLVDTSVPVWQTLRKNLRLIDERVNVTSPDDISYVSAGYAPLLVRLIQSLAIGNNNSWVSSSSSTITNSSSITSTITSAAVQEALRLLPGPVLELSQNLSKAEEFNEAVTRSASEASNAISNSNMTSINNTSFGGTALSTAALFNYTAGILSSSTTAANVGNMSDNTHLNNDEKYSVDNINGETESSGDNSSSSDNAADMSHNNLFAKKVMVVCVVGGLSYLEIAAFRFLSKDPAFPFRIVMATTKVVSGSTFLSSMHHNY